MPDSQYPPAPRARRAGRARKQPFALAFRLGRYLAGKNHYATGPRNTARLRGWLGTAAQLPGLLAGLPVPLTTLFHEPAFPDGIACIGVLYKDSGIAPARLLIGTSRALQDDPANWLENGVLEYENPPAPSPEKMLT